MSHHGKAAHAWERDLCVGKELELSQHDRGVEMEESEPQGAELGHFQQGTGNQKKLPPLEQAGSGSVLGVRLLHVPCAL